MKRIVLLSLVIVMMATLLPLSTAAAATYGTVTGGWLRLRSAPSFDASITKSYYTGTVVEITATSGSWYAVKAPDGRTGYMYSSYVTVSGSGGSGGTTGTTAYVTSANGLGVRMRTGPSKGYRVLAVYPVGTQVSVLSTGILWSRIQVGTTVGYMMSEFLTATSPGTPTTPPTGSDMATVRSDNGYGVRLRSGPGTGYSIIGLYSVGTRVNVVTRGTTWDYIQVGSRLGYMMNYFLHYDNATQSVATAITVTAASTGMQGEVVDLGVTVTGTNLSSPAYTLAVSNTAMAEITTANDLHILDTATVGTVLTITATSVDKNASGNPLTATCTVTVTAAGPRVTSFSFDESAATVSIAGGSVTRRVGYSISGYNLTSPDFSLALSSSATGYVTASIDEAHEEIVLNINSSIPDGTVFTVTGTTTANDSGGHPKTATVTITITSSVITLSSIVVSAADTSLRYTEMSDITAMLYFSDSSYRSASLTEYNLAVTTGSTYASITTDTTYLLVPSAANLVGVANQTVVVTATSVENPAVTDTCEVLLYGRNTPEPPTLTSVTTGDKSATVHWTAPTNDGGEALTLYKLYYSTSETGTKTAIDENISTSASSYTVNTLINGTTYYFWMLAANGQGNSANYSNYLTGTPNPALPSAPQNLAVSSRGDGFVSLSWDPPTETGGAGVSIDHYLVYVDNASAMTVYTTSATCSGLTNAQTYSFSVMAVNDYYTDPGAVSEVDSNPVGKPGAPTITSISTGSGSITINWDAPSNTNGSAISYYNVYCKLSGDADPAGATDTTTGTTYTFSGLSNAEYQVWVTANNGYYTGADSNRENRTPTSVPSTPQNIAVTSEDEGSVSLSWDAPASDGGSAVTEYTVYYDGTQFTHATPLATSETVTGLTSGTTYTFTVYAVNANGAGTAATITGTPAGVPDAPVINALSAGNQQLTVGWDVPAANGSSINGYTIYYWTTDPGAKTPVAAGSNPQAVSGLTNGETYNVQVVANSSLGDSAASSSQNVTLPCADTISADDTSGAQGTTISINVLVNGTNLSSPSYTLSTASADGEIVGGQLHIFDTATVGNTIIVTATSEDPGSGGSPITDDCTVTVTAP